MHVQKKGNYLEKYNPRFYLLGFFTILFFNTFSYYLFVV